MVNQKKKTQVETIKTLLEKKNHFVLIKLEKITHASLESLRKNLKQNQASLKVIKNTLFERAVNLIKKPFVKDLKKKFFPLKETSAIVTFDDDWSKPLKIINDFIKKEKTLAFKFGFFDNGFYNNQEVEKIALLPGKDELMTKIISSLKAPTNKFVYALKYNINKLVYILKEKSKKN